MKKKIILILLSISFIITTLLTVVDLCCFDYSFYEKEYKELNIAQEVGCSYDELMQATSVVLDYTLAKRDNMDFKATIDGKYREYYDEREKLHMYDVKNLYHSVMFVRNIFLGLLIIFSIYLLIKKEWFSLAQTFNRTSLVFLFVVFVIGIYALGDFDNFWTNFHLIFFRNNDYWILDSRIELLIRMVPEKFFFDLVMRIIGIFLLIFSTCNIGALIYRKKKINHD